MSKSLKRQRYFMWKHDPRCYWCGVKTILPSKKWKGPPSPNLATIDHLRPRHYPARLEPCHGEQRHVLACWQCNNDRDRDELRAKPKEWFEERGGTPPLIKRPLEELRRVEALLVDKLATCKPRHRKSVGRSLEDVRAAISAKLSTSSLTAHDQAPERQHVPVR